jgi:ABC-type phosphonate transport system ATPase subunit
MIPTPTLRFWGFKEHPFADNILRDDLLGLFVGREQELLQVEDALGRSRVVGVYGNLGVGKSSFLHKLRERLVGDSVPVAYVHLNADSEDTLYRELLAFAVSSTRLPPHSVSTSKKSPPARR